MLNQNNAISRPPRGAAFRPQKETVTALAATAMIRVPLVPSKRGDLLPPHPPAPMGKCNCRQGGNVVDAGHLRSNPPTSTPVGMAQSAYLLLPLLAYQAHTSGIPGGYHPPQPLQLLSQSPPPGPRNCRLFHKIRTRNLQQELHQHDIGRATQHRP